MELYKTLPNDLGHDLFLCVVLEGIQEDSPGD